MSDKHDRSQPVIGARTDTLPLHIQERYNTLFIDVYLRTLDPIQQVIHIP